MIKKSLVVVGVVFLFVLVGTVYAQNSTNQNSLSQQGIQGSLGAGGRRNRVPQVMIDACTGKSEGAACEFSTPGGMRSGVCTKTMDKKYLLCRLNHVKQNYASLQQQGQRKPGAVN